MRKFIMAAAAGAVLLAVPTTALAAHTPLEKQYLHAYRQVAKKYGKRTPGRNIVKYGRLHGKGLTVRESLVVLRRMLAPPPAPRVVAAPTAASSYARTSYTTHTATSSGYVQPSSSYSSSYSGSGGAGGVLASIRACESSGNYSTNTGNGFYGAYQFTDQTWHAMGGSGHASDASPAEQDARAQKLYAGGAGAGGGSLTPVSPPPGLRPPCYRAPLIRHPVGAART
jgi:hypothetical protein